MIHFLMSHAKTYSSTGYFRPAPFPEPSCHELMRLCRMRPQDVFLRDFLLEKILAMDEKSISPETDSFFRDALAEARHAAGIQQITSGAAIASDSPLAYMRIPSDTCRQQWIRILSENIFHLNMTAPQNPPVSPPPLTGPWLSNDPVPIEKIPLPALPRPPLPGHMDVFYAAMERLKDNTRLMRSEKRHTSTLSPIALLRQWDLDRIVEIPGYTHRLSGVQTSYGRGFSLEQARVACLMEAAERITAFAGVSTDAIPMRLAPAPIRKSTFSSLKKEGTPALDPNTLLLEAPMPDLPIWWMPGQKVTLKGPVFCLVPVQCVLLFSNLPEPQLFTALGSTGLAAGSSEDGAKLGALLEVLERDAEATMPHNPENCFSITSDQTEIRHLMEAYASRGIHPFFEDITTEFGVPAYRCLVRGKDGTVIRGTAAHLCGKKALLAALTETPWPFPGPSGLVLPSNLPLRPLEDLPDYSTDNPSADLRRLENCLLANGYTPFYATITRSDLRIPVVRSLVPGLEIQGDFDRFSPVNRRLFTRYQQMFKTRT